MTNAENAILPCRIFNLYDDSSDKRNKIDLQLQELSFSFQKIAIGNIVYTQ